MKRLFLFLVCFNYFSTSPILKNGDLWLLLFYW